MNEKKIQSKGARKAALLLLSLGKDEAAKILSHLDDKMIERIIGEMSKINVITKAEKESILNEFSEAVGDLSTDPRGGKYFAKDILSTSLGEHKAEEIMRKVVRKDEIQDFDFLNEIDSQILSSLLMTEAPQTIAVTLGYIKPNKAAEVLKYLPADLQGKVALKLASTSKTHPEAIIQIAKVLKKKYEERDKSVLREAGGTQSLADILNHMDKNLEDNILKELNSKSPDLAYQVKDKLYTFEDILNLDIKEMRILINRLGSNDLLVVALRGAGDEMRRHFFNSMSQNRAADIVEEMEHRGKLTLREINLARSEIVRTARSLEEDGLLILKKKKEEFI